MADLLGNKQTKTFRIESAHPITPEHFMELKKVGFETTGSNTVEITVSGDGALTGALATIVKSGVVIKNIEQKGGKLEDIFVELTS